METKAPLLDTLKQKSAQKLESAQDKVNFLKRPLEQRREDILTSAKEIVAHAQENPNDEENPINLWLKNEQKRQADWFFGNGTVSRTSTTEIDRNQFAIVRQAETATPESLDQLVSQTHSDDLRQAFSDAVGIVAVEKYTKDGNLRDALLALSARPDLCVLPEVTDPLTTQIEALSQQPDFLTDVIPNLVANKEYGSRNFLDAYYPRGKYDLAVNRPTPKNGETIGQYIQTAEQVIFYRDLVDKNRSEAYGKYAIENTITQKVTDCISLNDREKSNEFRSFWFNKENAASGPEKLIGLERITSLCQSELFSTLSPESQDTLSKLLTAATIIEIQNTNKDIEKIFDRKAHFGVLGKAIATAQHIAPESISPFIKNSVEEFNKQRPVLAPELKTVIDATTQEFSNKAAAAAETANQARLKQEADERENQRLLTEAENNRKLQRQKEITSSLLHLTLDETKKIAAGEIEGHNSPEEIDIAKQISDKTNELIAEAQTNRVKSGGLFGIGGTYKIPREYILGTSRRVDQLANKDELSDIVERTAYLHTVRWSENYESKD